MSYKNQANELTCKPLDSLSEILLFLKDPPPWRSLCKELTQHSQFKIKNADIVTNKHGTFEIFLEEPETFCHFSPDAEDPKRHDAIKLPKTLLCHDMANGYHDDSYIDGTGKHDAYTFYNWAGIDIFCYFSHHFITIPPVSWINVGHAHGVKVIGTVITEWSEGMKLWEQILECESDYQNFASALVAIASILKFDGWLLNIENKITKPKVLLEFLRYLNLLLHQEIPHAELIWYDSVTASGNLNWQNELNNKNRDFFDVCDGIFTNYSWSEFNINCSAIEADKRITDLYIGIDVWGRNFYGGGEFNTQEAIKLVHDYGCSLAIFAPGWTHEAMLDQKCDATAAPAASLAELDSRQRFLLRDRALWGSFWPFLHTRLPCALPFKTSFCRGQGKKRRLYGEVISPGPWYNLRHQQYQPNSAHGPHGYLLSTPEGVLAVQRGFTKDPKGIIRYRESFQASRMNLLSTRSRDPNKSAEPEILNRLSNASTLSGERVRVDEKAMQTEQNTPREDFEMGRQLVPDEHAESGEQESYKQVKPGERPALSESASAKRADNRLEIVDKNNDDDANKCKRMMKKAFKNIFRKKASEQQEDGVDRRREESAVVVQQPRDESAMGAERCPGESVRGAEPNRDVSPVGVEWHPDVNLGGAEPNRDVSAVGAEWQPDKSVGAPVRQDDENEKGANSAIAERRREDSEVGATCSECPGRSMVTVSVNLRLGKGLEALHRYALVHVSEERECLEPYEDDAFTGGACLCVHPSDALCHEHRLTRLLHCDFPCRAGLLVCVATKVLAGHGDQYLNVKLFMKNASGQDMCAILVGRNVPQAASAQPASSAGVRALSPLEYSEPRFKEAQRHMLLNEPGFYVPVENSFGWVVRYYEVPMAGCSVTSVNLRTGLDKGPILLGHFGICEFPSNKPPVAPKTTNRK